MHGVKRLLMPLILLILFLPTIRPEAVAYDEQVTYETLGIRFWEDETPPIGFYINAANRYILETVDKPRMGSTYGEWSVMNLLRGAYTGYNYLNYIPAAYYDDYMHRINGYVVAKEGNLDRNKSTEWSRLMLTMSALGQNIEAIGKAGTYVKAIAVVEENGKQTVEFNNAMSATAVEVLHDKLTVKEAVAVLTTSNTYEILQPGTYTVTTANSAVNITNSTQTIAIARDQLATVKQPYNFAARLSQSHKFSYRQGINGPIWVLIAMNTGNYSFYDEEELQRVGLSVTAGDMNSAGKMIDYILAREITTTNGEQGGWALSGKQPDADITGMALQAFAPYYLNEQKFNAVQSTYSYTQFKEAVERGVLTLDRIQRDNGGYDSWGTLNAESTVQVIVALTALQIDPLAETVKLPTIQQQATFTTNGAYVDGVWTNNMISALLTFFANGSGSSPEVSGFKHVTAGYDGGGGSGTNVNAMATDQAAYGLIAYDRFLKQKNSLYDMTDMTGGEYKQLKATQYDVTFITADGKQTTKAYAPYAKIPLLQTAEAWNTNEDGSGARYFNDEALVMPEHAITLYEDPNPDAVNTQAVQRIISDIAALPSVSSVTKELKNRVDSLQAAYDKLTDEEKQRVTNYATLLTVKAKVNELVALYDDELKVENLIQTIASLQALPAITRDYEQAIRSARVNYNNLTAKQRQRISNAKVLNELEGQLAVAIEQENGSIINKAYVERFIEALPSLAQATLQHSEAIFKAAAYVNVLSTAEANAIARVQELPALIDKMHTLQLQLVQTEDLEDELNDDTYGQQAVIGNTLYITAARTTGPFQVRIQKNELFQVLKPTIKQVVFSDTRGVELTMSSANLLAQLHAVDGAEDIVLHMSQLDYSTAQFTVRWETSTGEALKANTYMQLTIPYSYFVNGYELAQKQVVKIASEPVATAHRSNETAVTLRLFEGATFQFTAHDFHFSDVGHYADTSDLYYLANRLIVKGTGDGQYSPSANVTRAQFAAMLNRALGLQAKEVTAFTDVKGKWYEADVQALYEAGIIKGTSPTTFNPSGFLTRQQAAIMMVRVLDYMQYNTSQLTAGSAYKDAKSISAEATPAVYILKNLAVMSGTNNMFQPSQPLTRMQLAKILKRTLNIAQIM